MPRPRKGGKLSRSDLKQTLIGQAMEGTQLLGSFIAQETMPFNEFEARAFYSGYSAWVERIPAEALERAVQTTSTGMLIAASLSYGNRVLDRRQSKRRPKAAPEPGTVPHGPNGTGNPNDVQYVQAQQMQYPPPASGGPTVAPPGVPDMGDEGF